MLLHSIWLLLLDPSHSSLPSCPGATLTIKQRGPCVPLPPHDNDNLLLSALSTTDFPPLSDLWLLLLFGADTRAVEESGTRRPV